MFDPSPSSRRSQGFTLVELMVAVAVVGIIAAIAIPSYRSNVRSAQRANAAAVLVDCAQKLERYYSQGMTYVGATVGASGTCVLPPGVANHYTISIEAPTPTAPAVSTYALKAVPTNAQSADSCKALCVDSSGAKLAGNATGSGSTCAAVIPVPVSASCW